jgi:transposase
MIHPKMKYTYIGIDSHKETHTAVALDCFYEVLGEVQFRNAPADFEKFLEDISKFRIEGTTLLFGMEDISAYGRHLMIFLKEKKQNVKHVHAGLVASERKSFSGNDKTDSIDAQCAGRVLLNRFDKLPDADSQDKYWILRGLVVRRRNIVKMHTNLINHLHSFLTTQFSGYVNFFSSIDQKIALDFFEKYPSPKLLENTTESELTEYFKNTCPTSDYKGIATKILKIIKKNGYTTSEYSKTRNLTIKSIIRQIKFINTELEEITAIIADFLNNFEYKLESMDGIDTATACNLITEIGDISAFKSHAALAKFAGVAPLNYSSGKSDVQFASVRGNRTLNAILYKLAITLIRPIPQTNKLINPIFYHYYQKKISEGKTTRQAIKVVQRRLVTIIWGMMTYKTEYLNPPSEYLKAVPKDDKNNPKKAIKKPAK